MRDQFHHLVQIKRFINGRRCTQVPRPAVGSLITEGGHADKGDLLHFATAAGQNLEAVYSGHADITDHQVVGLLLCKPGQELFSVTTLTHLVAGIFQHLSEQLTQLFIIFSEQNPRGQIKANSFHGCVTFISARKVNYLTEPASSSTPLMGIRFMSKSCAKGNY